MHMRMRMHMHNMHMPHAHAHAHVRMYMLAASCTRMWLDLNAMNVCRSCRFEPPVLQPACGGGCHEG